MSILSAKGEFWDKNLLKLEDLHYNSFNKHFFRKFFNVFSSRLKNRHDIALSDLKHSIKGKMVLELGCGSGVFAEKLLRSCDLKSYVGLDISPKAIEAANRRDFEKYGDVSFYYADLDLVDINKLNIKYDYVISFGFLDCFDVHSVSVLFNKLYDGNKYADHFHSFLESNDSVEQAIYSLYVKNKYGVYAPKFYTAYEIEGALYHYFKHKNYIIKRDKRMGFSSFLMSNF